MNKLLPSLLVVASVLTANQAMASVQVENNTNHKIEVYRINQIFMHHYRVTIDSHQCVDGLKSGRPPYRLKSSIKRISFGISDLCVGSADHEVIEAIVTDKDGNVEILCIDNDNNPTRSYTVHSMNSLH